MRMPAPTLRTRDIDPYDGFRRDVDDFLMDFGRRLPFSWDGKGEKRGLAALDIAETKEALEISTELPGVAETDVNLSVEGHAMVISGEKKSESEKKDKAWRVVERSYGAFRRVAPLTFAPDVAKIRAAFDKGVLHVSVGKPEELMAKKVAIPIQKAH